MKATVEAMHVQRKGDAVWFTALASRQMFTESVVTKDKPKCGKMVVPISNNIFGGNTTYHTTTSTKRQK